VVARPWQAWALDRALEHRADGSLRWPVVVLSVSRQSGKSIIGRIVCGWRQDAAADLFGEPQTVVSTANKLTTALELWQGVAYAAQGRRSVQVRWARGAEEIGTAMGSRWLVQAATPNLAVGLSVSLGLVDEAWNVQRDHVESSLVPTMLERESPQLWIVSTQGDSGSDLLESYRRQGVKGIGDPDTADVLLLEWSADPSADVNDREAWRQASPHWSPRREAFIASQLEILPDQIFRTQILNQRVDALGGWVTRGQWAECEAPGLDLQAGQLAPKIVAACEYSEDGSLYALVVTQRIENRIVVRTYGEPTIDGLWQRVCRLPRSALLLVSVGFKGRLPLAPCDTRLVGVNELRLATRVTLRAIADGMIAHDGNPELSRHVLTAVVAYTGEAGPVLSQRRSPGPITYARALTWCVGATLEIPEVKPRPAVFSGSRD
jgi:phage terminase large subunit-like protein